MQSSPSHQQPMRCDFCADDNPKRVIVLIRVTHK